MKSTTIVVILVTSSHNGIENMVSLLARKYDSHLHRPQKLEVHLHAIGLEYETAKMTRVNQGL
jgi:hypothetical protein